MLEKSMMIIIITIISAGEKTGVDIMWYHMIMMIIIIRHLVYYIRGKPESFNIEKLSSIRV